MQRKVIVTGLGVVSPIGIGKSAFLESLRCGRSGIGGISLFDTSSYRYKLGAEVKDFCPDKYFGMKELRRRFCDQGWRFACNGVVFTGAASVAVTRYRYRGNTIATPWTPKPAAATISG